MATDNDVPESKPTAPLQVEKPSFLEWVDSFLPFKVPRIPLPQTAKNVDKAFARVIDSGGSYVGARIDQAQRLGEAQTSAQIDLIKRGAKEIAKRITSGDESLIERSIAAALGEQVRSQKNREAIAEAAAKELAHDPPTSDASKEIDDDWLNLFATLAAGKSNADMQSLWGKLLAGEIRQPGSFKLSTLSLLASIDASEANLIHQHMGAVLDGRRLFCGSGNQIVSLDQCLELQAVGVIQEAAGTTSLSITLDAAKRTLIRLASLQALQIDGATNDIVEIDGVCPLTPFGRDLYTLARPEKAAAQVPQVFAEHVRGKGRTVTLLDLDPHRDVLHGQKVVKRTVLWSDKQDAGGSPAK